MSDKQTTEPKTVTATTKVEETFVTMWNKGESKSKIINTLYDTGLTVSGVLKIFQKYGVKMIYNHIYNVVSKTHKDVRTEKGNAVERAQLTLK